MIKTGFMLCLGSGLALSASLAAGDELIRSKIVAEADAHVTQYDGSLFRTYFYGETVGTQNAITGVAEIEPNNEIHPPHVHAEEEYLIILEGEGTWTLNGVSSPASAGDVLYVEPWDLHGIFNSGDKPLKFFIVRWNSKGLPVPERPGKQD